MFFSFVCVGNANVGECKFVNLYIWLNLKEKTCMSQKQGSEFGKHHQQAYRIVHSALYNSNQYTDGFN